MNKYWVLNGKIPVMVKDGLTWGKFMESGNRVVSDTRIGEDNINIDRRIQDGVQIANRRGQTGT